MRAPWLLCSGLVLAVPVLSVPAAAGPPHAGVTFFEGSVQDALASAQKGQQTVLVEVYATWCGPCKRQAKEVFDTADGALLAKGTIPLRLDFDAPAQQAFMKQHNVLSLPTILFLRPDGTEIGRIEGYEDKAAFLAEAEPLVRGDDALARAKAKLTGQRVLPPQEARALRLTVAHAELVRGHTQVGLQGLTELARSKTGPDDEVAQDALFLKGRYFSRVKEDHARGHEVWMTLFTSFPTGKYRQTALWWAAGDLLAQGAPDAAIELLADHTRSVEDADLFVSFVEEHHVGAEQARRTLDKLKLRAPDRAKLMKRLDKVGGKS